MMRFSLRKLFVPFAFVVIALGLWHVGGPEQARREFRDDQRVNDLYALAAHVACERRQEIEGDQRCPSPPRDRDRFTEQPFKVTDSQVCAQFEQPDRIHDLHDGRIVDGCLDLD